MAVLIAEIVLLLILALNIPIALRNQKRFLSTCNGEYKIFQDANLKKFTILFFVVLILAALLTFIYKQYYFLLAAALMLFLLMGTFKNSIIVSKDKLYFRECAIPLVELDHAELIYTNKNKIMIVFVTKSNHKFGYAHRKPDVPVAISKEISKHGIPLIDKIHKEKNNTTKPIDADAPVSENLEDASDNLE
ncbi:MAG: hypothetical protein ACRDDY_05750 [Clostridium sp.]|uniref:hypothetical protein n=1 Tax=Clostridium sp. TaxID=1506 RepID=UPI003EE441FF